MPVHKTVAILNRHRYGNEIALNHIERCCVFHPVKVLLSGPAKPSSHNVRSGHEHDLWYTHLNAEFASAIYTERFELIKHPHCDRSGRGYKLHRKVKVSSSTFGGPTCTNPNVMAHRYLCAGIAFAISDFDRCEFYDSASRTFPGLGL